VAFFSCLEVDSKLPLLGPELELALLGSLRLELALELVVLAPQFVLLVSVLVRAVPQAVALELGLVEEERAGVVPWSLLVLVTALGNQLLKQVVHLLPEVVTGIVVGFFELLPLSLPKHLAFVPVWEYWSGLLVSLSPSNPSLLGFWSPSWFLLLLVSFFLVVFLLSSSRPMFWLSLTPGNLPLERLRKRLSQWELVGLVSEQ